MNNFCNKICRHPRKIQLVGPRPIAILYEQLGLRLKKGDNDKDNYGKVYFFYSVHIPIPTPISCPT